MKAKDVINKIETKIIEWATLFTVLTIVSVIIASSNFNTEIEGIETQLNFQFNELKDEISNINCHQTKSDFYEFRVLVDKDNITEEGFEQLANQWADIIEDGNWTIIKPAPIEIVDVKWYVDGELIE